MDYSNLAEAIRANNSEEINDCLETLIPRMKRFLKVQMNASDADAEDCAQQTLLVCIEKIRDDKIEKPDRILSYILTTCRNTYLKMKRKNKETYLDKIPSTRHTEPRQLSNLVDKEREDILRWCVKQLKKKHRKFINYWFKNPDYKAKKVADYFGLSESNTWTRKHRIIKKLNNCYEKKNEL